MQCVPFRWHRARLPLIDCVHIYIAPRYTESCRGIWGVYILGRYRVGIIYLGMVNGVRVDSGARVKGIAGRALPRRYLPIPPRPGNPINHHAQVMATLERNPGSCLPPSLPLQWKRYPLQELGPCVEIGKTPPDAPCDSSSPSTSSQQQFVFPSGLCCPSVSFLYFS